MQLVTIHLLLSWRHYIHVQGAAVININYSVIQKVNYKLFWNSDLSNNTLVALTGADGEMSPGFYPDKVTKFEVTDLDLTPEVNGFLNVT